VFEPNAVALDIFGKEDTSGARRRCSQSAEGDKIGRVILDITPERGRH